MAEFKGVMVLAEVTGDKLSSIATELLGAGRKMADELGQELSAVILGSGVSNLAQEAIAFGADKVYVADDPLLKDYQTDSYVSVMDKVAKQVSPKIILLGQTSTGRDMAPRLAFRLGTAVTTDSVALALDPETKRLVATKPVYGGNARAVFSYATDPQIATVRIKVMSPIERNPSRKGEVINIKADLAPTAIRTKVLDKVKAAVAGIKIEDAAVIVTGGRGMGSAEAFKELEVLSKLFSKGAVGASRPAVDSGWMPETCQVGLTGKIVSPDLYIAVAVSGSSQHMAGCSGSKVIVAINRDPEANIFKEARFGVVGDWKKVVPAFTQKVKELVGG